MIILINLSTWLHIPNIVWSLNSMSWELAGNQLGDKIPFSFGKFKQLEYLDQTQLVFLDLSYNSFQGHLPFSLGKLEQLSHLLLSTNNFTCQILNEFSIPHPTHWVGTLCNNLDGHALFLLGNLEQLSLLDLSNNNYTGDILIVFRNLTRPDMLSLLFTNFTGKISVDFVNTTHFVGPLIKHVWWSDFILTWKP